MAAVDALYVHIPFCHSICPFCAFAVHQDRDDLRPAYLEALRRELPLAAAPFAGEADIRSVYIGGGTPSALGPAEVRGLLSDLRGALPVRAEAEIAFEVNPEDGTPGYFAALREAGVTRVSLGVQSLDDATLQALGRTHSAEQARAALDALAEAGIANANADLMFGAPGIAPDAFRRDVDALIARRLPHLSLYGLDIEEHTLFGRDAAVRAWSLAQREVQGESFLWAHERLVAAGYRHYEVSNFCLPGFEGRQNLLVWSGRGYLGLGTGAHSFARGERWHNERHLRAYQRALAEGRLPIAYRERLTPAQEANERLLLALRQAEGLDVIEWAQRPPGRWDAPRQRIAERLTAAGQATFDGTRLRLTATGFLVADAITEQLMVA